MKLNVLSNDSQKNERQIMREEHKECSDNALDVEKLTIS